MLEVLGTKPFVTKTVRQLMWGYDDPLLKIAKDIIPPDKRLPHEQFGFFIEVSNYFFYAIIESVNGNTKCYW